MNATTTDAGTTRTWCIVAALLWLAVLVLLFVNCGSNPNFWFDESGQFWMSRGQTHFMPPLTPDGTLADVLQANRTANSDPGGFTVLLHWWLAGGSAPAWLRTLPFLFFVATMAAFAALARLWTGNRGLALAAGLVPAAVPLLTRFAFELRAYSMEACGVAVVLLLLYHVGRRPTVAGYLGLGCVAALFLTSRYSLICTLAAAAVVVWWQNAQRPLRQRAAFLAAYGIPVAAACLGIYLVTLGHPLAHQKPEPPDYVQLYILHGKSLGEIAEIFGKGLASTYLGSVLFGATWLWCRLRRDEESGYRLFTPLFIMVLLVNAAFALLSFAGKYPWCPQLRWGISLDLLAAAGMFPTVLMLWKGSALRRQVSVGLISLVVTVAAGAGALAVSATTRLDSDDHIYANLMALGPEKLAGRRVFVEITAQPSVRYLFEYGPLKQYADGIYPRNFQFEVPANMNTAGLPIDYFLSPGTIRKSEFSR
ncbi:glycosyltransferase family 39 protein [Geomonas sp. Red875]|uniref:Glycosyltransferase family 39 protein n=2 Tax=Geomesophilobacter sediminis TaxID=2798584 RepID=A0A8J7M264_9BACT|nr:glycosyltransferase family 39 protein [Geomesophilobacter sediminis]